VRRDVKAPAVDRRRFHPSSHSFDPGARSANRASTAAALRSGLRRAELAERLTFGLRAAGSGARQPVLGGTGPGITTCAEARRPALRRHPAETSFAVTLAPGGCARSPALALLLDHLRDG
jgi:hypothetical protein